MSQNVKIFYQPQYEDRICENGYVVFVNSEEALEKWRADPSSNIVNIVAAYQVWTTGKQGVNGELNEPSNLQLDTDWGTHKVDDIIPKILKEGSSKGSANLGHKFGTTNASMGPRSAH